MFRSGMTPVDPIQTAGVAWADARGAFLIGDRLYVGWADGGLDVRGFDGLHMGTPRALTPWIDPAWDGVDAGYGQKYGGKPSDFTTELAAVTGLAYLEGYLYDTLDGQPELYRRGFSPDSGVVGAQRTVVPSSYDFSHAAGMTLADRTLFVAQENGDLVSMGFGAMIIGEQAGVIDGPAISGRSWNTNLLVGSTDTPRPEISFEGYAGVTGNAEGGQVALPASAAAGQTRCFSRPWAWARPPSPRPPAGHSTARAPSMALRERSSPRC